MPMTLYDSVGNRKYLTVEERDHFLRIAASELGEVRTFCNVLAYTGCRSMEALELTYDRVNLSQHTLTFEMLHKGHRSTFRTVPIPAELITLMDHVHHIHEKRGRRRYKLLWTWSRSTAWRHVHQVMERAEIHGPQATAKGLRHGFGVLAVERCIPLTLVQKWMGHAKLETTASYEIAQHDEHCFAARLWSNMAASR